MLSKGHDQLYRLEMLHGWGNVIAAVGLPDDTDVPYRVPWLDRHSDTDVT